MIPQSFEYLRPESLREAISLLQQHGDGAKILSGGQSLIPMMKMRLARPEYLIDINRIPELHHIKEEGGYLKIGGLTREADLEHSDLIRSRYPIILDTAAAIADPQVRNMPRSAATSRTAIRPTIIRRPCWPCGLRLSLQVLEAKE
jgi:carbon-monoxide dehydrogenase medium subunit